MHSLPQVVRTKQKIRDFVFSVLPPKGTLAQITLSLANNSIEVRSRVDVPAITSYLACRQKTAEALLRVYVNELYGSDKAAAEKGAATSNQISHSHSRFVWKALVHGAGLGRDSGWGGQEYKSGRKWSPCRYPCRCTVLRRRTASVCQQHCGQGVVVMQTQSTPLPHVTSIRMRATNVLRSGLSCGSHRR